MLNSNKANLFFQLFILFFVLFFNQFARAASFDINSTVTDQQILTGSQTGVIQANGALNVNDLNGAVLFDNSNAASLTNNGSIVSTGNNNMAISESGDFNIISNSKTISASGDNSTGVRLGGTNATITNSGSITAQGNTARSLLSLSAEATINNSGIISSQGGFNSSIEGGGENLVINNSGIISSQGEGSVAVNASGNNTIINNSGTISASGANSSAISFAVIDNTDLTLINTGKIIASGDGASAIASGIGRQTIILGRGSEIIGTVDLGGGTDSISIIDSAISSRILTSNVESISISNNVAGVVIGNEIHIIDPTASAMLAVAVNKLTLNIQNSISSHRSQASITDVVEGKKSPIWANLFNSNFSRGADRQNLAYRNQTTGFVGGYDLDNSASKGFIFGASSGQLETKSYSVKTDVDSFFVGGYQNINLTKATTLGLDLIAGYEKYNSSRAVVDNINGYQTARADFNNLFISPSATLGQKIKITEIFELSPFAKLSYTASRFGEAREKGNSGSNITTKSRNAQIFNSRIGVNTVLNLQSAKFELGTGFDMRKIKEGSIAANIDGNNFRYNTNNDKNVNGHYLRAAAYIINLKNFSLNASFEKRQGDGREVEYASQLGGSYKF